MILNDKLLKVSSVMVLSKPFVSKMYNKYIRSVYTMRSADFLLQTEEEFLEGLTSSFADDTLESNDEAEEEDKSDESEEEGDEEEERVNSQNGGRSKSLHLPLERRADVVSMVYALKNEGEIF